MERRTRYEHLTIVQKLWNWCDVLRDDGMTYGDYAEQLTNQLREINRDS